MTLQDALGLYNYWIVIFLMMTGFYIVIASQNLIKSIIGLNIFQTSVFLLYITMGKVSGGTAPIIPPDLVSQHTEHQDHTDQMVTQGDHPVDELASQAEHWVGDAIIYSHPLPSVLMLTAIVVGIATTALALSLIVRIREDYGTVEEDEILILDHSS